MRGSSEEPLLLTQQARDSTAVQAVRMLHAVVAFMEYVIQRHLTTVKKPGGFELTRLGNLLAWRTPDIDTTS
jgi:hypothetical protein